MAYFLFSDSPRAHHAPAYSMAFTGSEGLPSGYNIRWDESDITQIAAQLESHNLLNEKYTDKAVPGIRTLLPVSDGKYSKPDVYLNKAKKEITAGSKITPGLESGILVPLTIDRKTTLVRLNCAKGKVPFGHSSAVDRDTIMLPICVKDPKTAVDELKKATMKSTVNKIPYLERMFDFDREWVCVTDPQFLGFDGNSAFKFKIRRRADDVVTTISDYFVPAGSKRLPLYDVNGICLKGVYLLEGKLSIRTNDMDVHLNGPIVVMKNYSQYCNINPFNIHKLVLKNELAGNVLANFSLGSQGSAAIHLDHMFDNKLTHKWEQDIIGMERLSAFLPQFRTRAGSEDQLWFCDGSFVFGGRDERRIHGTFEKVIRSPYKAPFTIHDRTSLERHLELGIASGPMLLQSSVFWSKIDSQFPPRDGVSKRIAIILDSKNPESLKQFGFVGGIHWHLDSMATYRIVRQEFVMFPPVPGNTLPMLDRDGRVIDVTAEIVFVLTDMSPRAQGIAGIWCTPGIAPDFRTPTTTIEDFFKYSSDPPADLKGLSNTQNARQMADPWSDFVGRRFRRERRLVSVGLRRLRYLRWLHLKHYYFYGTDDIYDEEDLAEKKRRQIEG